MKDTVSAWMKSLRADDQRFILTLLLALIVNLAVWWVFTGRKRYSTKGATSHGR